MRSAPMPQGRNTAPLSCRVWRISAAFRALALTGGIFVLHWLAELFPFVRECFTRPLLLIGFSFLTAVVLPSVLLIQKRRQHA